MSYEDYTKCLSYLDVIEGELNKIAAAVDHPSVEEFFKEVSEDLVQAA